VPQVFAWLEKNVAANPFQPQINLVSAALSDAAGKQIINISTVKNQGLHTLAKPSFDAVPHEVDTYRLDSYLAAKGVTHVDFIKLDVEGWEYYALQGAKGLLDGDHKPFVLFEAYEKHAIAANSSIEKLKRYMDELGYVIFKIDPSVAGKLLPVKLADQHEDDNLLAIPRTLFISTNLPTDQPISVASIAQYRKRQS
jgi:FkbM family methyltransferase